MLSMYPPPGIHFRNPFLDNSRSTSHHRFGQYGHDLDVQSPTGSSKVTFSANKPPTPPPDMNSVAPGVQALQLRHYGDHSAGQSKYNNNNNNNNNQYDPAHYGQPQVHLPKQAATTRAHSPVYQQHPVTFTNPPSQRKDPQANAIAPALQIPRSVNNSQGSIAELAAQITCLFWFESSSILERAEEASDIFTMQSLAADAIPTTGFRKWVTTILSTTQVAQNVIILALLFIYRLKKLNPSVRGKPGSEYRLLTVALMLGNKFLDDNTYTNKTWAEVSGISVAEVHIMEVEFLSNMKYALFTSAEEWQEWQNRLGRFASFFERASRPMPQLPPTLPSPPSSNHASPPYHASSFPQQHHQGQHGTHTTPNPSPLGPVPDLASQASRKRSLENSGEPPAKRVHMSFPVQSSTSTSITPGQPQYVPRVTLPSLSIPQTQPFLPQLPPLNYSHRSVGPSPQSQNSWTHPPAVPTPGSYYSSTPMAASSVPQSAAQSRHPSPFPASAGVSPTNGAFQPAGQVHMSQLSPSFFLAQRNSPYRPVRGVSTLLVPPPSRAMQQPQHVDREQMHYQPLGRPQERQQGRLPYIESQWYDGAPHSANQWYQQPQQGQQPPNTYYGRI